MIIAAILVILLGLYIIKLSVKERTGCGCLGIIVAGLLFILIILAIVL